jgi:hypothetical protein
VPPDWHGTSLESLGIDRVFEGPDADLIVVTRVDQDGVGVSDQGIPVLGRNIVADLGQGVDIGLAHGHDLALEPNLHPVEGQGLGKAILDRKGRAAGQGADMG